jgi:hypothetical protein
VITEGLLTLLLGAAQAVVGALPDAGSLGLDGFGDAISAFRAFDSALPVHEALAMASGCLLIIGGIFATRLVITVYRLIPFKFT